MSGESQLLAAAALTYLAKHREKEVSLKLESSLA